MSSSLVVSTLAGVALAGGLVACVRAAFAAPPRLSDALAHLDGAEPGAGGGEIELEGRDRSERFGLWVYRTLRVPMTSRQRALLELKGKPVAEFMAEKAIFSLLAIVISVVVSVMLATFVSLGWALPLLGSLAAAVVGFVVPDLQLRANAGRSRADAGEALFTYFDLVTLERLANMSATQALASAAQLSDHAVFVRLRGAVERARLEQRPPYGELRRLAGELGLPELTDIADVMSLDESGASLTTALRARVKELRDAHLTRQKIEAHAVSERMTLYMTAPAMVFALVFLIPPMLRLSGLTP